MTTQNVDKKDTKNLVKRKTGVAKLKLKSESVFLYMRGQSGENLNKSLYRIGELFKMTSRSTNKDSFNKIRTWFVSEILDYGQKEIDKLMNHFETLQDNTIPGISFVDIKSPDMELDISIIHKSHAEIINLITKIDYIMDEIETMSLSGSWDDDGLEQTARTQALLILNTIALKIFKVTKPGKRNGGAFSAVYFLEGLQSGVFTLYPDESDVKNEKVDNSTEIVKETKTEELSEAV